MQINNPWGASTTKSSTSVTTTVVVNALFAGFILFISMIYSFLELPMFGDEMESSPTAIIIKTFILIVMFDAVAVWRLVKLSKLWSLAAKNKVYLWSYQLVFIGVIGYSNFWLMTIVWFWWDR